jgi:hypothetical protein
MAGCQNQKFWVAETDFVENKCIDVNQIYSDSDSATCITMSASVWVWREFYRTSRRYQNDKIIRVETCKHIA